MRLTVILAFGFVPASPAFGAAQETVGDFSKLPANRWVLIHREDGSGGKAFSRAVFAENVGRVYLWGTGGKKPARNVYLRYELERFDPKAPRWEPAFPAGREELWTAEKFPPFRIYGQSGPDGLKYDEGPRLKVVGGYHATNRVRWWDFDGILRPSPVHTFNMACWDSKRKRVLYFSDGFTFSLDPRTNTWTDLKPVNHPTTCRTVAWAAMEYDAGRDRVLLFGGGLATNPQGGAPTWIYDCAGNAWRRPTLGKEPSLRCNPAMIYDSANQAIVLFGGYDQAAALNDTWVFDCRNDRWEERSPKTAPPPMFAPTAAAVTLGKVLVCGFDGRKVRLHNQSRTSAVKETWVYDAAENAWTPLNGDLKLEGYRWLSATRSAEANVALLVAFGRERRTYAFRYDPAAPAAELEGAKPDEVAWKYPEQKDSLEQAPPATPGKHAQFLVELPSNEFVDLKPPGLLISKTWSTAVIDTDRSEVIYVGGGHSGYSGNDFARYRVADNRWGLDAPPRFPPFLESTNAGIFGWSYGMVPFSQHTYLWYCYDPLSRSILYLARPSLFDGVEVQLGDDPDDIIVYKAAKHGYASWVYDLSEKKMRRPSFGRTFANPWHLSLVGTPNGPYALCNNALYNARVGRRTGRVLWMRVDSEFPKPEKKIKYHYEFQPVVYDSHFSRLVQLKGDASRVDVYVRSVADEGKWEIQPTQGRAAIGREAVYIARHNVILWLGKKLYALDLETNRMGELDVAMPKGSYSHECAMVYDPAHDVCVALIPSRFTGPMQTFAFRFDPKSVKYR